MSANNHDSPSLGEALARRSRERSLKGISLLPHSLFQHCAGNIKSMLDELSDKFPSSVHLDAFNHSCNLSRPAFKQLKSKYSYPKGVKVREASANDRTCNWSPTRLCVYKGALDLGFRFSVHPFIVELLNKLKIHLCQLYPNAWGLIVVFIVRCHQLGIPLCTTLFRSIFIVKNSPLSRAGWVQINHRTGVDNIVNALSLPDSNHGWQKIFLVLEWEGGDWGEFFSSLTLGLHNAPSRTFLANAYFTSLAVQSHDLREKNMAMEKSFTKYEQDCKDWELLVEKNMDDSEDPQSKVRAKVPVELDRASRSFMR
ncbi:hypothetical protein AgCh_017075 [Apium graveolens]